MEHMGMSTHVIGFKPPDEEFKAKLAAYRALEKANLSIPDELSRYFNYEYPEDNGVRVQVPTREWRDDDAWGYEIDITSLDPSIKVIRFYNAV